MPQYKIAVRKSNRSENASVWRQNIQLRGTHKPLAASDCGFLFSDHRRDIVALNLTETHKTVLNIKARKAFTVSIADAEHVVEADYFGVESGKNVADKLAASGLTAAKSENVDAPIINEFPLCLECEFIEYQGDKYGLGVIGRVVNTTADERVLKNDKVDIEAVGAIAFDPYTHGYYKVSDRVGDAFKDGLKLKK